MEYLTWLVEKLRRMKVTDSIIKEVFQSPTNVREDDWLRVGGVCMKVVVMEMAR